MLLTHDQSVPEHQTPTESAAGDETPGAAVPEVAAASTVDSEVL